MSLHTEVFRPPAKSRPRLVLPTETWGKQENKKRERERESYSKIWLSISRVNTNVLTLSVFCPKQRGLEKKRERDRNQSKRGVRERESSEMVKKKKKADYFLKRTTGKHFGFPSGKMF